MRWGVGVVARVVDITVKKVFCFGPSPKLCCALVVRTKLINEIVSTRRKSKG